MRRYTYMTKMCAMMDMMYMCRMCMSFRAQTDVVSHLSNN